MLVATAAAMAEPPPQIVNPIGRPRVWKPEWEALICQRLRAGQSLRRILIDDDELPAPSTVYEQLTFNQSFAENYARAREVLAERWAEEIVDLADEAHDTDSAAAARVRIDARKWVAAKLLPKRYGDAAAPSQRPTFVFNVQGSMGVISSQAHEYQQLALPESPESRDSVPEAAPTPPSE